MILCWLSLTWLLVGNSAVTRSSETPQEGLKVPPTIYQEIVNYFPHEELYGDPLMEPAKIVGSSAEDEEMYDLDDKRVLPRGILYEQVDSPEKESPSSDQEKIHPTKLTSDLMSRTAAKMLSPNFRTDDMPCTEDTPFKKRFIDLIETLKSEKDWSEIGIGDIEGTALVEEGYETLPNQNSTSELDSKSKNRKDELVAQKLYDNYLLGVSSFLMQGLPLPDHMTVPPSTVSPSVDLREAHLVAPYMTIAPRAQGEPPASEPPTPEPIKWSELYKPLETLPPSFVSTMASKKAQSVSQAKTTASTNDLKDHPAKIPVTGRPAAVASSSKPMWKKPYRDKISASMKVSNMTAGVHSALRQSSIVDTSHKTDIGYNDELKGDGRVSNIETELTAHGAARRQVGESFSMMPTRLISAQKSNNQFIESPRAKKLANTPADYSRCLASKIKQKGVHDSINLMRSSYLTDCSTIHPTIPGRSERSTVPVDLKKGFMVAPYMTLRPPECRPIWRTSTDARKERPSSTEARERLLKATAGPLPIFLSMSRTSSTMCPPHYGRRVVLFPVLSLGMDPAPLPFISTVCCPHYRLFQVS